MSRLRRIVMAARLPQCDPDQEASSVNVAIPIFDRVTALDAAGPYEVLAQAIQLGIEYGRPRPAAAV